jgi:hypothetical protein
MAGDRMAGLALHHAGGADDRRLQAAGAKINAQKMNGHGSILKEKKKGYFL